MKIFEIYIPIRASHASLRPYDNDKEVDEFEHSIPFMWEDWGIKGNTVQDFIYSYFALVGKAKTINELKENFGGFEPLDVDIVSNPKEIAAKDISKLKWLPQGNIDIKCMKILRECQPLENSTIIYDEEGYIDDAVGVAKFDNGRISNRKPNFGFFFNHSDLRGDDFFRPANSGYILCTQNVKEFVEDKRYENIVFLEVGEII